MLQPQDLILTILGVHLRAPGASVWSGGLVVVLSEFGFSEEAVRAALARVVLRGLLTRERRGRRVFYSLTASARTLLDEGDDRIYSFGRRPTSSTAWTMLWHRIPQDRGTERSRLASGLRFRGFGSPSDSVWIACTDQSRAAIALIEDLEIGEFVTMVVGHVPEGRSAALVESAAWDFPALERIYVDFIERFGRLDLTDTVRDPSESFLVHSRATHAFRGFMALDPELPSLDRISRLRRDAVAVFDDVNHSLIEPARVHFERSANPPA